MQAFFATELDNRLREPETMDDPELDPIIHFDALAALARLNFWSLTAFQISKELRTLTVSTQTDSLRVLDVACGGGDLALALEKLIRRRHPHAAVDGCDVSRGAVRLASENGLQEGAKGRFFEIDLLGEPIPRRYQVVISSLFLHHLSEDQAVELLEKMAESATVGLIVSDLERCRAGYALAYLASRILTRSPVVRIDSLISVRSAFTVSEIENLARKAGLKRFTLVRCWPFRLLLRWRKS